MEPLVGNEEKHIDHGKQSHYKHILLMSACFFFLFFAFNTSQSMQTSLSGALGYINLGCLYGMFAGFSIVGPAVVGKIGPKTSMIIGSAAYALVVIANFWPIAIIQIPANLLVGMGAAILWNAQGVYLSRCSLWDSRHSNKSFADVTSEYNGLFFSIFQFTGCVGTLICGLIKAVFPNVDNKVLFTILSIAAVIAFFCFMLVPSVASYESQSAQNDSLNTVGLSATLSLLCTSPKVQLIMPLALFNGMSLAFIVGDVTNDISNQYFGLSIVLIATSVFYGTNAFFSLLFGKLAAGRLGRRGCCAVAFITQVIALGAIVFYRFHAKAGFLDYVVLLTAITLLAAGDSIWESQPPAILQTFFGLDRDRNAAIANLKMWQSLGNVVQFVIGVFLKMENRAVIKSIILLVVLTVGYICLLILDYRVQRIDMKKGESSLLLSAIVGAE